MKLLQGAVRSYVWGSRTVIAELLDDPVPAPHPQAELWFGAHPSDPSQVLEEGGRSLLDIVRDDPDRHLGADCQRRWGDRLPFLLKVLAAEEPLSLQAHPSQEHAREGFAREEVLGIPLGASQRNYPDPYHKPELLCALTEFHALAGFRDAAHTVELLDLLATPGFAPYRELLAAQPDADGLRSLFTTLITLPQQTVEALLPPVLERCVDVVRDHGPFTVVCRNLLELAGAHPNDVGVLAAALLNHVVLAPGEALYVPPGHLHTYLRGSGVEVMSSSDNVLRGGLTAKHVDVPELVRVLDFTDGACTVTGGDPGGAQETVYRVPVGEFALTRLDWEPGEATPAELKRSGSPEILLCTAGRVELRPTAGGTGSAALTRGLACWIPAADPTLEVLPGPGGAQVFRATVGGM